MNDRTLAQALTAAQRLCQELSLLPYDDDIYKKACEIRSELKKRYKIQ